MVVKVLLVKGTIYLEMKSGETREQAEKRVYDEFDKTDFSYCVNTTVEKVSDEGILM